MFAVGVQDNYLASLHMKFHDDISISFDVLENRGTNICHSIYSFSRSRFFVTHRYKNQDAKRIVSKCAAGAFISDMFARAFL